MLWITEAALMEMHICLFYICIMAVLYNLNSDLITLPEITRKCYWWIWKGNAGNFEVIHQMNCVILSVSSVFFFWARGHFTHLCMCNNVIHILCKLQLTNIHCLLIAKRYCFLYTNITCVWVTSVLHSSFYLFRSNFRMQKCMWRIA